MKPKPKPKVAKQRPRTRAELKRQNVKQDRVSLVTPGARKRKVKKGEMPSGYGR